MDTIARGFTYIFIIQVAIFQVSAQPTAQYVLSNYANGLQTTQPVQPIPNIPKPPPKPIPKEVTGPLDSNVLNNLAIALQLLIVSNIMNMPEPERSKFENLSTLAKKIDYIPAVLDQGLSKGLYESKPLYTYDALPKPSVYYDAKPMYAYEALSKQVITDPKSLYYEALAKALPYDASIPNANFLGSSSFAEPAFGATARTLGTTRPNPRSSMTLMSPYDALGTSSLSDGSFPSSYSKMDFQSPYASILAADGARDLFSVSDFF